MLLYDGRSRALYGLMLGVLGDSFGAKKCIGKQFAWVQGAQSLGFKGQLLEILGLQCKNLHFDGRFDDFSHSWANF